MVPTPPVLCLWVPQFLPLDPLSIMWVSGVEGRVYEILRSCPSKVVFLHELTNPFLIPWQMLGEQEEVQVGLFEWMFPFSKLPQSLVQ